MVPETCRQHFQVKLWRYFKTLWWLLRSGEPLRFTFPASTCAPGCRPGIWPGGAAHAGMSEMFDQTGTRAAASLTHTHTRTHTLVTRTQTRSQQAEFILFDIWYFTLTFKIMKYECVLFIKTRCSNSFQLWWGAHATGPPTENTSKSLIYSLIYFLFIFTVRPPAKSPVGNIWWHRVIYMMQELKREWKFRPVSGLWPYLYFKNQDNFALLVGDFI